jgi:predicted MarR family transcription regulator
MSTKDGEERRSRRIVSSRHLATEKGWQLSEYEYGLIMAYNAFSRWMLRCMAAAGNQEMSPLDILVTMSIIGIARRG